MNETEFITALTIVLALATPALGAWWITGRSLTAVQRSDRLDRLSWTALRALYVSLIVLAIGYATGWTQVAALAGAVAVVTLAAVTFTLS